VIVARLLCVRADVAVALGAAGRVAGSGRRTRRTSEKWVMGCYVAFLLVPLIVGPVFIAWQRAHSRSARALAAPSGAVPGRGPGWSIGGWFVPIANMVLPAVEVHQSARASSTPPGRSSWLIPVWMATFASGGWITTAATTVLRPVSSPPFDDLDIVREAKLANEIAVVGFALLVVAAVTGAATMRTLTARQARRLRLEVPPCV
jgi:hypothetical protein